MNGDSSSLDTEPSDSAVRGMVERLKRGWNVESITRHSSGTDFVATLGVRTAEGKRTVVLKATTAGLVAPEIARLEPRLLELIGRETTVPVPTVFGYCDADEEYPAPFYVMSHVAGENYEGNPEQLSPAARERVLREAGRNLASLHRLGPLPAAGHIGVHDGQLTVLDTDEYARYDDFREWLLVHCEETLDSLTSGGWFSHLSDEPPRFADLVPAIREYVRETVPELPAPDPPTYCHRDYRYGNLLVDSATGETRAVLDWANLLATDPTYNLASAESLLLAPQKDGKTRTNALRRVFRTAYAGARGGWSFDAATRERLRVYRLHCRLGAMACLPLWYQDATHEERDERAVEHREFVAQYI